MDITYYHPHGYSDRIDAKWKGKYTSGEVWCRGIEIIFNTTYASMWERNGSHFTDNFRYRFQYFDAIIELVNGEKSAWWKLSNYDDVMSERDYIYSNFESKNDSSITDLQTKPFYKDIGCAPTMNIFQLHSDREEIVKELRLVEKLCEENDVDLEFV